MKTLASLLALALLTASCGGKVVVDPVADPAPTCQEVCEASSTACGADPSQCITSCAQLDAILQDACPDAYTAWLTCVMADPAAQCDNTGACGAETDQITNCIVDACSANPAACI